MAGLESRPVVLDQGQQARPIPIVLLEHQRPSVPKWSANGTTQLLGQTVRNPAEEMSSGALELRRTALCDSVGMSLAGFVVGK
jgi:hypothetical protein